MHILLRGSLAQRLRIASGLILFTFALTHFLNHALGLVDIETMQRAQDWRKAFTRSIPGTIVLGLALFTHVVLALAKLANRRTPRNPVQGAGLSVRDVGCRVAGRRARSVGLPNEAVAVRGVARPIAVVFHPARQGVGNRICAEAAAYGTLCPRSGLAPHSFLKNEDRSEIRSRQYKVRRPISAVVVNVGLGQARSAACPGPDPRSPRAKVDPGWEVTPK